MQVSVISTPKARKASIARRFERRHPIALPEPAIDREIDAARIGDRRHPHPPLSFGRRSEAFEKPHPGLAQGFGVGHDVRLRHGHEIGGVEELADRDLMRDRPAPGLAELAGQHRPFFVGQSHRELLGRDRDLAGDQILDLRLAEPGLAQDLARMLAQPRRRMAQGAIGIAEPHRRPNDPDAAFRGMVGQRKEIDGGELLVLGNSASGLTGPHGISADLSLSSQ